MALCSILLAPLVVYTFPPSLSCCPSALSLCANHFNIRVSYCVLAWTHLLHAGVVTRCTPSAYPALIPVPSLYPQKLGMFLERGLEGGLFQDAVLATDLSKVAFL